jgi:hypothetical protein
MPVGGNGNSDGAGRLAPAGLCRSIDQGDALGSNARIYHRRDLVVRQLGCPLRSLNDPLSAGDLRSELDLGPPAETLLPRPIFHFQWKTQRVQSGVHRFVEDCRRDLGIRELGVHREGQLHQSRPLLVEVGSPACKPLHDDVCEILLEMPEVVGYVALDQGKAAIEARDDGAGVNVGPRVVDHHRDREHLVTGSAGRLASGEQPQ